MEKRSTEKERTECPRHGPSVNEAGPNSVYLCVKSDCPYAFETGCLRCRSEFHKGHSLFFLSLNQLQTNLLQFIESLATKQRGRVSLVKALLKKDQSLQAVEPAFRLLRARARGCGEASRLLAQRYRQVSGLANKLNRGIKDGLFFQQRQLFNNLLRQLFSSSADYNMEMDRFESKDLLLAELERKEQLINSEARNIERQLSEVLVKALDFAVWNDDPDCLIEEAEDDSELSLLPALSPSRYSLKDGLLQLIDWICEFNPQARGDILQYLCQTLPKEQQGSQELTRWDQFQQSVSLLTKRGHNKKGLPLCTKQLIQSEIQRQLSENRVGQERIKFLQRMLEEVLQKQDQLRQELEVRELELNDSSNVQERLGAQLQRTYSRIKFERESFRKILEASEVRFKKDLERQARKVAKLERQLVNLTEQFRAINGVLECKVRALCNNSIKPSHHRSGAGADRASFHKDNLPGSHLIKSQNHTSLEKQVRVGSNVGSESLTKQRERRSPKKQQSETGVF